MLYASRIALVVEDVVVGFAEAVVGTVAADCCLIEGTVLKYKRMLDRA